MNTQQRQQERIRLWELDREAAYSQCAFENDMRIHGCHIEYLTFVSSSSAEPNRVTKRDEELKPRRKVSGQSERD
jgi:hypothetical protein